MDPSRILIVRLGAIGDCLRVLPSLALLRQRFPRASIGWAVGDLVAPLLAGHPAIDRLHVLERAEMKAGFFPASAELRRLGRELAAERYDVAIDLHTRLKSGVLTFASRAPLRIGLDRQSGTEANFLFTNRHVSLDDRYENRVTRFFRILSPLGIEASPAPEDLRVWVDPAARDSALSIFEAAGRPEVVIFTGTSVRRRDDRWPLKKWREVIEGLGNAGLRSLLLWGPGEFDSAAALAHAHPSCQLSPPTTLPEMMALVGLFRLYAGSNTAALHMAWMQGVPAVVLVGGRPHRTDRPLAPVRSVMLSAGGREPARKLHGEAARRAVEGIEVPEVLAACLSLLG